MNALIEPPSMPERQHEAWVALLQVAQRLPEGWALVGGQMVMLHCWERGSVPARLTVDADAVLDIRTHPDMLRRFTGVLDDLGFTPQPDAWGAHEIRWGRGGAIIDVLVPEHVGRAAAKPGVGGRPTIQTPGGLDALEHSRSVDVRVDGLIAAVARPHLPGALLAKARAYGVRVDPARARHLEDAVILASLLARRDLEDMAALRDVPRHRKVLDALLQTLQKNPQAWQGIADAGAGVERLRLALGH